MAARALGLTRDELASAIVGALAFAIFLVWIPLDGGFEQRRWLPGALFLLALLAVLAITRGISFGGSRLVAVAVGAFALFTAWNGASILWADVRGDAWEGTNRTLLYLCVYLLFVALPWTPRTTRALLGSYVVGVAAIVAFKIWQATSGGDPNHWLIGDRLAVPMDYANANASLCLSALFPAVLLASRREVPAALRGLFLACAGLFAETFLLCQSRSALLALPVVTLLVVAIVPGRTRFVIGLVPVAVAATLTAPTLLDVYADTATLPDARLPIVWTVLALFAIGALWGLVDRRADVPGRVTRAIGAALAIASVAVVVAGAAVLLAVYGDPVGHAKSGWNQFKANERFEGSNTNLFSGVGSKRYDLWRVALIEFRESPLVGIGSENFGAQYLKKRRTEQDDRYPHSLPLKILSQTGLVGSLLFATFLVAALAAAWRATRQLAGWSRVGSVAALAYFAYWLVHGSFDWFWERPALSGPAFAALALAARTTEQPEPLEMVSRDRRRVVLGGALAAVAMLVAAASLTFPWLSQRYVDDALAALATDPAAAIDGLEHAHTLNPLTDQPDLLAAVIAGETGDAARAREFYRRAIGRNPTNWFAHFRLAIIDGNGGRRASAVRQAARAKELNPGEELVDLVLDRVRRGLPVDSDEIDEIFLERSLKFRKAETGQPRE